MCPILNAFCVLHHDKLVKVLSRTMRQGGAISSKEPLPSALHSVLSENCQEREVYDYGAPSVVPSVGTL
jgi:hypothetical protein